jgi:myosin heavy subunit
MKDIRPLLLVLLSVGLVATWVYHLYDKAAYSRQKTPVAFTDSAAITRNIRDSLQKAYSTMTADSSLDSSSNTADSLRLQLTSSQNTSDSLRAQLTYKIKEINTLKNQISNILKNPNATSSELSTAREKMKELEEKVQQLRNENSSLEAEKKNLTARLDQISGEVTRMDQNIRRLDEENKNLTEKIKTASVFMASALHFTAINIRSEKEVPTKQANKADKFIGSFVLQNNLNQFMNAEVFVVITEPDGHILQNSAWDSGTFDTKQGAKKSFTRKVKFDYAQGEQKRLIFSLDMGSFQKGKYTLQLWHNGTLIGETAEILK